jgi:hypothetical protein
MAGSQRQFRVRRGAKLVQDNARPIKFDTYEQAAAHAKSLNENAYSPNVHYYPKEMEPETEAIFGMSMKLKGGLRMYIYPDN